MPGRYTPVEAISVLALWGRVIATTCIASLLVAGFLSADATAYAKWRWLPAIELLCWLGPWAVATHTFSELKRRGRLMAESRPWLRAAIVVTLIQFLSVAVLVTLSRLLPCIMATLPAAGNH